MGNAAWTRRSFLGAGATVAAAGVLSACGSTLARLTRAAAAPTVLTWRPWSGFPNGGSSDAIALLQEGIQPWLDQNPGVQVRIQELPDAAAVTAQLVAGNGPDIFEDAVLAPYSESHLALDLSPYLRREGAAAQVFSASQLAPLQGLAPGPAGLAQYGLPAHTRTVAMAVNRGLLDSLGMTEPQPDWNYQQWAALWQQVVAARAGSYGGQLDWSGYDGSGGNPAPFYLAGFGGEYVDPQNVTRAWIDQPASVAALQWCYGLSLSGVCGGAMPADFTSERLASAPLGTTGGLLTAAEQWQGLDWNLYSMPIWPRGRLTLGSGEFCAIWSGTHAPDVAWSLVRYLCLETAWQRYLIRLALIGPNQTRLWGEWQQQLTVQAPPLAKVDLDVFTRALQEGQLYSGLSFRFAEQESTRILAAFGRQVLGGTSVAAAAAAAAQQIDAVQAAEARVLAAGDAAQAHLRSWASSGTRGAAGGSGGTVVGHPPV